MFAEDGNLRAFVAVENGQEMVLVPKSISNLSINHGILHIVPSAHGLNICGNIFFILPIYSLCKCWKLLFMQLLLSHVKILFKEAIWSNFVIISIFCMKQVDGLSDFAEEFHRK